MVYQKRYTWMILIKMVWNFTGIARVINGLKNPMAL